MLAFASSLPTLNFLPSLPPATSTCYPNEREIDREMLLDIAPDREALLKSSKSIDEIRQALKLRTYVGFASPTPHWLYRTKSRQSIKNREATARMSALLRPIHTPIDENTPADPEPQPTVHVIRRVLSASSLRPLSIVESRVQPPAPVTDLDIAVWGDLALSNAEKLISPRPLGPTHILIAFTAPPAPPPSVAAAFLSRPPQRARRRIPAWNTPSTQTLELPINDLLFALNAPNLAAGATSPFPRRLHKELPRVHVCVPHLDSFRALVVFLHTRNQAELFRSIVPEWIRDLMHPLPVAAQSPVLIEEGADDVMKGTPQKRHRTLFGIINVGAASPQDVHSMTTSSPSRRGSINTISSVLLDPERTIDSIAQDIADAAGTIASTVVQRPRREIPELDSGKDEDPLVRTAAGLDALRDNLEFIGFYGRTLWNELTVTREILLRSITLRARIETQL